MRINIARQIWTGLGPTTSKVRQIYIKFIRFCGFTAWWKATDLLRSSLTNLAWTRRAVFIHTVKVHIDITGRAQASNGPRWGIFVSTVRWRATSLSWARPIRIEVGPFAFQRTVDLRHLTNLTFLVPLLLVPGPGPACYIYMYL